MMQGLLNYLESLTSTVRSDWDSHMNPRQYAWEMAIKAYTEGELARKNLIYIGQQLQIPRDKFNHDFDVAFDLKQGLMLAEIRRKNKCPERRKSMQ